MSKLQLEVVISHSWSESRDRTPALDGIVPTRESRDPIVRTGVRVFGKHSFHAALLAIKNGCLGQCSKHSFWLIDPQDVRDHGLTLEETWLELAAEKSAVNIGAIGTSLLSYPLWADALMWEGFHKVLAKQMARKDAERRPSSLRKFLNEFFVNE